MELLYVGMTSSKMQQKKRAEQQRFTSASGRYTDRMPINLFILPGVLREIPQDLKVNARIIP
jgi:hypothetical protein